VADITHELERRREAAADAWDVRDAVVLVAGGSEIEVPGRGDRSYPFRAHSEYVYLTDRERPGGVLAFDPDEGWVEFVVPVTAEELLWSGLAGDREGIPEGTRPLDQLEAWIRGRPVRRLGATADADGELRDALVRVRRPRSGVLGSEVLAPDEWGESSATTAGPPSTPKRSSRSAARGPLARGNAGATERPRNGRKSRVGVTVL
jgi:hypothetical protein